MSPCPIYKFVEAVESTVAFDDIMTGDFVTTLNTINRRARARVREQGYSLPSADVTLKIVKKLV